MSINKEKLREKLIEFQLTIAEQNRFIRQREDRFKEKELTYYLNLFDMLDAFENINKSIEAKKDGFDKTAKMLGRNIRSIHRKLLRIVEAEGVIQIEFPDGKAKMEYCKVIETKQKTDSENGTISSIMKQGYIHENDKIVLRKAEVVTVLNEE